NADGSVTYSPVSGFTGDDSFTYTISDGLLTATATVAMTVGGGTTVTAASVTPAAASKIYGSADPALTRALSGFLAADDVTAVYSRTAGETVAGSPYMISATLSPASVLGHYSITYNTANFTITNAPLTVTAGSATKVFGAPNPVLPVNYSGFVNGDTPASLTTQPTVSTPATAASPVGTYPTAASANYTIGYVSGNLTILQAAT